ncbi:MAG: STT3 domain-containing protein [Candidatus Bathyarchaeia archaeon]
MKTLAGHLRSLKTIIGEGVAQKFKGGSVSLRKISRATCLNLICILAVVVAAATLRSMPLRWGLYLSEFDPYIQYFITEYIVNNGFISFFSWHDTTTWYPWGRNIALTSYPGLAFTTAILYKFLHSIGFEIPLMSLCVVFPVILGTATCLVLYIFSKELWGRSVGLFSALFLAFSSSHIFRTAAGFYDDETIGIFSMLIVFHFYLKAISPERSFRSSLIYSLLSGMALAYLASGWGAYRYPMSLIALFTLILAVVGRYSIRLLSSYGITFGAAFLFMAQLPQLGFDAFREWTTIAIPGGFLILCGFEFYRRAKTSQAKIGGILASIVILTVAAYILWLEGFMSQLAGKFITVLYPTTRVDMPIVESVAEHRLATWSSFYHEFGMLALLGIFGFYSAGLRRRNSDIFLILFGLSSMYFAASLVRLSLIMAPAIAVLAAITVSELATPAMDVIRETVIFPRKKIRIAKVGREFGVAILLVLLLIITPTFNGAVRSAYAPATIVTSSLPTVRQAPQDWLEALTWMRDNLPDDAVVFSWWDYGYWISVIGGKHSLADNGTLNTTQIAVIGRTFLSDERASLPVLKRYNVTHIALLVTWYMRDNTVRFYGFGEDSKWYWMARISNGSILDGETVSYYARRVGTGENAYTVYDRVLTADGKLLSNKTIVDNTGVSNSTLLGLLMSGAYSKKAGDEYFRPVFTSSNKFVILYEVKYLEMASLTLQLARLNVTYPEQVEIMGVLKDERLQPLVNQTVHLQYSEDKGVSWITIKDVSTVENGSYRYLWSPPTAGDYLVRAGWDGIRDRYASASLTQNLTVVKGTPTVKLSVEPTLISVNRNVSIDVRIYPPLSTGTVTIEVSSDNRTWVPTIVGEPARGLFTPKWSFNMPGLYYVRASWTGTKEYKAMTSNVVVVTVSEKLPG